MPWRESRGSKGSDRVLLRAQLPVRFLSVVSVAGAAILWFLAWLDWVEGWVLLLNWSVTDYLPIRAGADL